MRSEGRSYLGRAAVPERGATVRCIAPSAHPCLATAKLRKAGGGVADGGRGEGWKDGGGERRVIDKKNEVYCPGIGAAARGTTSSRQGCCGNVLTEYGRGRSPVTIHRARRRPPPPLPSPAAGYTYPQRSVSSAVRGWNSLESRAIRSRMFRAPGSRRREAAERSRREPRGKLSWGDDGDAGYVCPSIASIGQPRGRIRVYR